MKRIIAYLVCFLFMISAVIVFAEIKSLIKEYTYQASELDSKTSCRAIALEQVKRELLEELGTYIESTTVVRDAQIEKDEIKTISAGVVQTKILDEKWDGKSFWLKAEVSADPDEVAASIDKIRNDQKLAEELAESQAEKGKALQEVDRLKAELAQSNADKEKLAQYNQAVNQLQASDSFEQGTAMNVAGDYEGATKAYERVIYLRPDDPKAYFGRSIVYINLGNYERATQDLDRAMVIRPANTNVYFQRASAYKSIREAQLNDPYRQPYPGQRLRPIVPVPRQDPLKRFLDNKQTQHRLVKVNPFQPGPGIRRDPRQVAPPNRLERKPPLGTPRAVEPRGIQKRDLSNQQKRVLQQQRNREIQQSRDLRQRQGSVARDQRNPEVRRQVNVPPQRAVQPRVERAPKRENRSPQQLKDDERSSHR